MRANAITDCEKLVMKCIWDSTQEELSLLEITDMVNRCYSKNWKKQTIMTFLARLEKKKYLKKYRQGASFYYQPLVEKEEFKEDMLKDYVQFWHHGSMAAFVCELFEKGMLRADGRVERLCREDIPVSNFEKQSRVLEHDKTAAQMPITGSFYNNVTGEREQVEFFYNAQSGIYEREP